MQLSNTKLSSHISERFQATCIVKNVLTFPSTLLFSLRLLCKCVGTLAEKVEPIAKLNKNWPHISIWLPHVV